MVEHMEYLQDIILLLSSAILVVTVFKKIGLSPVLGYLFAGAAIGQYGSGLISADSEVGSFAEFGVVFLLFVIGLELTFDRLMSMRLHVFGFGSMQTLLTAIIISFFCYYGLSLNSESSIIIGGSLALSSTAIVLQVLKDSGQQSNQTGRLSLAVLLMQDFLVVPLFVLVPLLSYDDTSTILPHLGTALMKASIALIIIFVAGRLLLRPLLVMVSSFKSDELFVATTLLLILGSAYATQKLELSMAMGAFMAGLMVAETEFRHEVEHAVLPFKGILLGLFFMTVGMNINLPVLTHKIYDVLLIVISIIAFKSLMIFILCKLFKFNTGAAINAGLLLSQGGEFAFIIFGMASELKIMPEATAQILMVAVTITMAITPLLSNLGSFINHKLTSFNINKHDTTSCSDLSNHVIIAGHGRVGRVVAKMLGELQINYVVVDRNFTEKEIKESKKPLFLGDVTDINFLNSINANKASSMVWAIDNTVTLSKGLRVFRENFPEVFLVVRLNDLNKKDYYKSLGASIIVPEKYEAGLQLASAVMSTMGINLYELSILRERFRNNGYSFNKAGTRDDSDIKVTYSSSNTN